MNRIMDEDRMSCSVVLVDVASHCSSAQHHQNVDETSRGSSYNDDGAPNSSITAANTSAAITTTATAATTTFCGLHIPQELIGRGIASYLDRASLNHLALTSKGIRQVIQDPQPLPWPLKLKRPFQQHNDSPPLPPANTTRRRLYYNRSARCTRTTRSNQAATAGPYIFFSNDKSRFVVYKKAKVVGAGCWGGQPLCCSKFEIWDQSRGLIGEIMNSTYSSKSMSSTANQQQKQLQTPHFKPVFSPNNQLLVLQPADDKSYRRGGIRICQLPPPSSSGPLIKVSKHTLTRPSRCVTSITFLDNSTIAFTDRPPLQDFRPIISVDSTTSSSGGGGENGCIQTCKINIMDQSSSNNVKITVTTPEPIHSDSNYTVDKVVSFAFGKEDEEEEGGILAFATGNQDVMFYDLQRKVCISRPIPSNNRFRVQDMVADCRNGSTALAVSSSEGEIYHFDCNNITKVEDIGPPRLIRVDDDIGDDSDIDDVDKRRGMMYSDISFCPNKALMMQRYAPLKSSLQRIRVIDVRSNITKGRKLISDRWDNESSWETLVS